MFGRHFTFFATVPLAAAVSLGGAGCSSDPDGDRGTRAGSSSASTSGGSPTGTSGTASSSTVGTASGAGASGAAVGAGGASTAASGSTGAGAGGNGGGGNGSTGSAGSGTSGTGGAAGSGGASRDGGSIADAAIEAAPLPLCNQAEWSRTKMYKAGDVVMYMGKAYVATSDNTSLDPTISTFYWSPYTGCRPPDAGPPAMCPVLDKLLPMGEASYKALFTPTWQGWVPLAAYSYASFCKALATPGLTTFVRSGNDVNDKRELAAFFANVALETAYLTYVDENGHTASEQNYHGRGSLQLTGQANYADCGAFLGLNLNGQPQLASQEPVVWQSGIWYWMLHANPSVGGAQISHAAIAQGNFGQTVRIIKGDCASANDRAAQYRKNCMLLGVDPGNTVCQ